MFIDDTDYFFGAVFAAESKRLMTSLERSRPGSAETTPESRMLKIIRRPLSTRTCSMIGFQILLESPGAGWSDP